MNDRPDTLSIDPWSARWLLTRHHPLPEFFRRGLMSLTPRAEQTVLGRVIADAEFVSGGDRWSAVAILGQPDAAGVHRLLDLGIQRSDELWPKLCIAQQDVAETLSPA